MTKSDKSQEANATHRKVQVATTRNRKTVKRPNQVAETKKTEKTTKIEKKKPVIKVEVNTNEQKLENAIKTAKKEKKVVSRISVVDLAEQEQKQAAETQSTKTQATEARAAEAQTQPEQKQETSVIMPQADMTKVHDRMRTRAEATKKMPEPARPTAKEIKTQAIEKALAAAAKTQPTQNQRTPMRMDWRRVVLALACAAAAVFAIVYFVNLNSPDISLRVAAMQTGIEASYPGYVPRDYTLSDITSEDGKVTLNFANSSTGDAFTLIEEKSSWDSNALLANFVKKAYGENYSTIKEQGLTIYISGSDAAWVNGGVVYKIDTTSGSLTKKQITNIAVSL